MALMTSDEILKYIPSLFEINVNQKDSGDIIFKKLEKVLKFDDAYIFFTNPESLQLKYCLKNNCEEDSTIKINEEQRDFVFSKNSTILDENSTFVKLLNLQNKNLKSFMVSKIAIKSTVFGLIVIAKNEEYFYKTVDIDALNACCTILSYVLKDLELSNVFRLQLEALKNGIIEKNEAYEVIKDQNEKILEADRVKNEFLANISHELRTPLNSILGFADILSTKLYGDLNSKQEEYVNDIKVSGTHLLGMINEILDMSKIEANAMKIVKSVFPISRAATEVCNILFPLAQKKNVKLICELENDFEVFADYQKIQQIMYNLLSNAIKYSPENNEVTVKIDYNNDFYRIQVHDNGIGIDKKYHGKIFAKFVQLDSAFTKKESSTGLGLTITKKLVELHEGKISLISEINNGSTFIVELPF